MRICNRCKVLKDTLKFKKVESKNCIDCQNVANENYRLKQNGKIPKYAKIQKDLKEAFSKGNFICNICNTEKDLKYFGPHINANKYGISRICKECNRGKSKTRQMYSKYGITTDKVKQMLIDQNNTCKVCFSNIKYLSRFNKRNESACIDHCHKTGKVRGLLCSNCNRALGLLKDNESIMLRAYNYLVQYKSDELLEKPEEVNQQPSLELNAL